MCLITKELFIVSCFSPVVFANCSQHRKDRDLVTNAKDFPAAVHCRERGGGGKENTSVGEGGNISGGGGVTSQEKGGAGGCNISVSVPRGCQVRRGGGRQVRGGAGDIHGEVTTQRAGVKFPQGGGVTS